MGDETRMDMPGARNFYDIEPLCKPDHNRCYKKHKQKRASVNSQVDIHNQVNLQKFLIQRLQDVRIYLYQSALRENCNFYYHAGSGTFSFYNYTFGVSHRTGCYSAATAYGQVRISVDDRLTKQCGLDARQSTTLTV